MSSKGAHRERTPWPAEAAGGLTVAHSGSSASSGLIGGRTSRGLRTPVNVDLDPASRGRIGSSPAPVHSSAASRLATHRAVPLRPISTRAASGTRTVVDGFQCRFAAPAGASASLSLPPNRPSTPGVVLLGVKIVPSTGILRRAADPDRVTPPACREDR